MQFMPEKWAAQFGESLKIYRYKAFRAIHLIIFIASLLIVKNEIHVCHKHDL